MEVDSAVDTNFDDNVANDAAFCGFVLFGGVKVVVGTKSDNIGSALLVAPRNYWNVAQIIGYSLIK